jgi:hypothetical protein
MNRARSATALIVALVILAALLLLGLPFLFTQSASLAGTRSFAHAQQAHIGRDAAENFAIGAASQAMALHLGSGVSDEWSSLYWDLDGSTNSAAHLLGPNRIGLDLTVPWNPAVAGSEVMNGGTFRNVVLGVALEDEAGKLDPNHLDAVSWGILLPKVGIGDRWPAGGTPAEGALARGLAYCRYDPDVGGRITRLEQLLYLPDPVNVPNARQLTRAELDQLRPYLSLANRGQGRSGLIDLGTILAHGGSAAVIDSVAPGRQLSFAPAPDLAGNGTTVVTTDPSGAPSSYVAVNTIVPSTSLADGRAISIEAPPEVNLHQATPPVRALLRDIAAPKVPASGTTPIPATLTGASDGLPKLDVPASPGPAVPTGPDALLRPITHVALLDPLATALELAVTIPQASQIGDPGGPGATDASGTAIDNPAAIPPRPVLSETALTIRITGGSLDRLPTSGYGRLQGTDIGGIARTEYIAYGSSDLPSGASSATLSQVTRHLGIPLGSPSTTAYRLLTSGLTLTIIGTHELPPLAIASRGLVTVDGAASVTDGVAANPDSVGHHSAQQARRIVVQALPQEQPLETRWQRQSQLHALLVQRNASLMTSFPVPFPRLSDLVPSDALASPGTDADHRIGLRPATLRTLLSAPASVVPRDWWLGFGGTRAELLKARLANAATRPDPAVSVDLSSDDLTPEGLTLTSSGDAGVPEYLAYAVSSSDPGLFGLPTSPGSPTPIELPPRQFGIWVKPTKALTSLAVIAELLGPTDNASASIDSALPAQAQDQRASGMNILQNHVLLAYDGVNRQLVLALNNGAIEFPASGGLVAPRSPPESFLAANLDPQTLGSGETATTYNDPSSPNPIAAAQPLHFLETRYQVGPPGGAGLTPGAWHHLQVAFTDNAPGGMALMVDGLAGRDITRLADPADAVQLTAAGDHFTSGVLVLKTDLPATPDVSTTGAHALLVDAIALDGYVTGAPDAATAVARVLPARGMVRIGNEYISYESISGATLRHCVRARRQNTDLYNATAALRYPVLESHKVGDAVVPGGYRFSPTSGRLYRGGCSLKYALPTGSLPDGTSTTNFTVTVHYSIPVGGIPAGSATIDLVPGDPLIGQLPPRGYVVINSTHEIIYYQNGSESPPSVTHQLQNIQHDVLPAWSTHLPGTPSILRDTTTDTTLTLISIEVVGADPTEDGRYVQPPGDSMFQVYDASSSGVTGGRCEWIAYTRTAKDGENKGFFIDDSIDFGYYGFSFQRDRHGRPVDSTGPRRGPSSRGQERTAFFPGAPFPAGSRIIPVQTQVPQSWVLASGDVVTLAPKQLNAAAAHRTWQACVRYAATDGYLLTATTDPVSGLPTFIDPQIGDGCDTHNEYFAFTESLPDPVAPETSVWNSGTYEILCWPCWSGRDLSPENPIADDGTVLKPYLLPWVNALSQNFLATAADDDRRVYVGHGDDRLERGATASPSALDAVIDALYGGAQPSAGNTTVPRATVIRNTIGATPTSVDGVTWIADGSLAAIATLTVEANGNVFTSTAGTQQGYGLAMIGGEVFAYQQHKISSSPDTYSASQADLIARGLLGSVPTPHSGREPVVILPIGPVAPLSAAMPTGVLAAPFPAIDAPAVLISKRDGTSFEVIATPANYAVPWLRGLYNTTPQAWAAGDIAIGWWPRYPSALPNTGSAAYSGLDAAGKAAQMRCRTYAWAGFPLRFYDSLFRSSEALGEVTVADGANGTVEVFARALASGIDWEAASGAEVRVYDGTLPFPTPAPVDISGAFNHAQFTSGSRLVDGAELRVFWRYHRNGLAGTTPADLLTSLADTANRAPTIGPVVLRCRAPAKIVSVESAR